MINLFDTYTQDSWDLHYSLLVSGYNNPTIVINDDGFLPNDVTSPYLFFTGFDPRAEETPLYFNQVSVPEFWEIRGNNSQGEIYNYAEKKGHIHYTTPSHKRLVKAVDWYDDRGKTRLTDRYNKQGYRFAQTVYNLDGQAVLTSYFNADNQEVLVENHHTGDVTLNYKNQVYIFKSRSEFIVFYLKEAQFELDRIFYNSLSTPFLVAHQLGGSRKDILFWQEEIGSDIPGNMQLLLNNIDNQTKIMVQDKAIYAKISSLLPENQAHRVSYLGVIYPTTRENKNRKEALIFTNSDQIEQLPKLVAQLPNLHFHVGAVTEMSSRLTDLGKYSNVTLYPNISTAMVQRLQDQCDIYLDINQGSEILSAVRTAFENKMLILAFVNTLHQAKYVAKQYVYLSSAVDQLIMLLKDVLDGHQTLPALVEQQESALSIATATDYQTLIG